MKHERRFNGSLSPMRYVTRVLFQHQHQHQLQRKGSKVTKEKDTKIQRCYDFTVKKAHRAAVLSQDTGFGPQTVLSLVMTSLSSRNQPIPLLKQDGLLETMRRPSSESFIELSEASPRTLPSEQSFSMLRESQESKWNDGNQISGIGGKGLDSNEIILKRK